MLALLIKTSFNWLDLGGRWEYATRTSPIMHLICLPTFCITFVFHFSSVLGITAVPREMENNTYAKCWWGGGGRGRNKVHYERWASGVFIYVLYPNVTRCLDALVVHVTPLILTVMLFSAGIKNIFLLQRVLRIPDIRECGKESISV